MLLAPSDTPLAYPGCAFLLDGEKNWLSRQIHCPFLPDSSIKPPSLMQGGHKGVGGGQKRVRVRYVKNGNTVNSCNSETPISGKSRIGCSKRVPLTIYMHLATAAPNSESLVLDKRRHRDETVASTIATFVFHDDTYYDQSSWPSMIYLFTYVFPFVKWLQNLRGIHAWKKE